MALLVTTDEGMSTIVMGIKRMVTVADLAAQWDLAMAAAVFATPPPVAAVVLAQRGVVKGLIAREQ